MDSGDYGRKVGEKTDEWMVCGCGCVCTLVYRHKVTMNGWAVMHTNLKQEDPLSMFTYHSCHPKMTTKDTTVGKTGSYLKTWGEERE